MKYKLTARELSSFCGQMGMLLHSGISTAEGLHILCDESKTDTDREILTPLIRSVEETGSLSQALEESGYFYSRLANPTNDCVAQKICELEGGAAAMLTGSGQAANYYAVFNICEAGDHVVLSSTVYGGTFNLLAVTMKKTFESKYDKHQPNRGFEGTVSSRNLYVLLQAAPVSVFVELGNIQNTFDQRRFVISSNRQALAKWMTEGFIADYKQVK